MKFELEFKNFEVFKAQAEAKGFKVDIILPEYIAAYHVTVTGPDGRTEEAYVQSEGERHVMDTGRWRNEGRRLRIAIGKKINIIGNKLKWMIAPDKEEDDYDRAQEYRIKSVYGELNYRQVGEWVDTEEPVEKEAT